jgi:cell division protein ZapA
MNDKMKINLSIGGNSYPINIDREDEELVRLAAKEVDTWYNKYRVRFVKVSPIQAMTMAAFQFSIGSLKAEKLNDTEPYYTKINELSNLLEEYIQKEK